MNSPVPQVKVNGELPCPQKSDHHETPMQIFLLPSAIRNGKYDDSHEMNTFISQTAETERITPLGTPRWTRKSILLHNTLASHSLYLVRYGRVDRALSEEEEQRYRKPHEFSTSGWEGGPFQLPPWH